MTMSNVPDAKSFTTSPLRNRLRLELRARPEAVWALVGDHTRFPEYSPGLAKVEVMGGEREPGRTRVCHFRPMAEGDKGMVLREDLRWEAPGLGYAATAQHGNGFGLENELTLVTLQPAGEATILIWDQHYDGGALSEMKREFDTALKEIGDQLVRRFGGRVLERYVEPHAP